MGAISVVLEGQNQVDRKYYFKYTQNREYIFEILSDQSFEHPPKGWSKPRLEQLGDFLNVKSNLSEI